MHKFYRKNEPSFANMYITSFSGIDVMLAKNWASSVLQLCHAVIEGITLGSQ